MDERFREMAELAPVALFEADPEGQLTFVNRAWCDLVGRTSEQVLGDRWIEIVHPEDRPALLAAWGAAVAGEIPAGREFRCGNGQRLVWVRSSVKPIRDAAGRLLRFLGSIVDITERRIAEEELARSEQKLRHVFSALPDAVVVEDQGKLVFCNEALAKLVGYPSCEAMQGIVVFSHVHPADRDAVRERVQREYARGRVVGPSRYRLIRVDGSEVDVEAFGSRSDFVGREMNIVVLRDITARIDLESRVRNAERMASLGALSAGIVHEINNPIATMLLNCQEMSRLLVEPASRPVQEMPLFHDCLADTLIAGKHVQKIVQGLRVFARGEREAKLSVVEVARVVELAAALARFELHRVRFAKEVPDGLSVIGNEQSLVQVLVNLLVNAAQAKRTDRGHEVHVECTKDERFANIVVRDTGTGMSPDVMARLFEPFFTNKPSDVGTGLGLTLSRNLVKDMHGTLEVESVLGEGTSISVRLARAG